MLTCQGSGSVTSHVSAGFLDAGTDSVGGTVEPQR